MAVLPIQLRRWSAGFADEGLLIPGEPLWDDAGNRLGIFGGDGKIHWYPALPDGVLGLSANTKVRPTNLNGVEWGWDGDDLVVRTRTGTVLARFSNNGVTLANAATGGIYPAGSTNEIVNAAFQCVRSDAPATFIVNNSDSKSVLFAPNWQGWAGSAVSTDLRLRWSTTDLPALAGVRRVLSVQVLGSGIPASAGVRTWVHDAVRLKAESIVTVWAKGPLNANAGLRVLNASGVVRYDQILGTGAWKAYTLTIPSTGLGANPGNWAALDALYCPQVGPANSGDTWLLGPVEWNAGTISARFGIANAVHEQTRVNAIYAEPVMRGTGARWQMMPEYTQLVTIPNPVTEFDHTGATYPTGASARLVAARLPPVPSV